MLFNKMYNLANDVEDLKENGGGSGGVSKFVSAYACFSTVFRSLHSCTALAR